MQCSDGLVSPRPQRAGRMHCAVLGAGPVFASLAVAAADKVAVAQVADAVVVVAVEQVAEAQD